MIKLKKLLAAIIVISFMVTNVLSLNGIAPAYAQQNQIENGAQEREKKEILVKFKHEEKKTIVKNDVKDKLQLTRLNVKKDLKSRNTELLEISEKDDINLVIQELRNNPDVLYAQPNYQLFTTEIVEDPCFDQQWGLHNSGQYFGGQAGTPGIDIKAFNAWDITKGADNIVVGVLDTGVDVNHPDLYENIRINPGEIAGNGTDDDNNGYVDDVYGYDFANNNNSVFDSAASDTHGTHVSGIIAAGANTEGIRGVAPHVTILPLKFINNRPV